MQMLPGQEEAYKKIHDEIWPEMVAALKTGGAHNYTISLLPATGQLFGYVEIESQELWDSIASTEVCQRWWRACQPFLEFRDGRPAATELKEMFFLK